MLTYTWYHWLAFFYFYCFFGWIFESSYVSIKMKHFVNRGFLRLPMLPLYGSGAVMMLWVSLPFQDSLFLTYLSGMAGATVLEYVTGWAMELLFKVRYWDYSSQKYNLNGYICLSSSIAWGFLTILMTEVIHQPIARLVTSCPPLLCIFMVTAVSVVFVYDTIYSVRQALALGKSLEALTRLRRELETVQVQASLLKLEARDRLEETKAGLRLDDFIDLRDSAELHLDALKGKTEQQLADLRSELEAKISLVRSGHAKSLRSILRGNPTAASGRFEKALRELREYLDETYG